MFGFIRKMFFTAMTFFCFNPLNAIPQNAIPWNANFLECVSMNNQECRARANITNINNNEPCLSFQY